MATIYRAASDERFLIVPIEGTRRRGGALEYVVHGDEADEHERGQGVEHRDRDGDHVDERAGDEPPARRPVLLDRQRSVDVLAVQSPLEDRAETHRHAEETPAVEG